MKSKRERERERERVCVCVRERLKYYILVYNPMNSKLLQHGWGKKIGFTYSNVA